MTNRIEGPQSAIRYITENAPGARIEGEGDAAVVVTDHACSRCGGTGSFVWGACVKCGGHRPRWTTRTPVVKYARQIKARHTAADRRERANTARQTRIEVERTSKAGRWRAANPEAAAALAAGGHNILTDLAAKLDRWGSLSPAQAGLASKIHRERTERAANPETHVPAPIGRVTFQGTIVKVTQRDGYARYDAPVTKIIVKVQAAGGVWLCWLTAPAELERQAGNDHTLRGATIEVTATVERGRDAHFAFGKRPTLVAVHAWGGQDTTAADDNHEAHTPLQQGAMGGAL